MSAPPPPPDKKRHLPLLPKVEVAAEGEEDRPPWHWAGIGTVGVFVFWSVAIGLIRLLGAEGGAIGGVLNAVAYALSCFVSGFLVGRFGGQAGRREAMVGGASAGVLACLIAATSLRGGVVTWLVILAVLIALGGGAAFGGGALGVARRKAQPPG